MPPPRNINTLACSHEKSSVTVCYPWTNIRPRCYPRLITPRSRAWQISVKCQRSCPSVLCHIMSLSKKKGRELGISVFSRFILCIDLQYYLRFFISIKMGNASAKAVEVKVPEPSPTNSEKPKLKPCCACPETKRVRDAW